MNSDIFLQWLKNVFLVYLPEWEEEVMQKQGYNAGKKGEMLLSKEAMEALRVTGILLSL